MHLKNKQPLLAYIALKDWFYITEMEHVYCAVRAESLYKTDTFSSLKDYPCKKEKFIVYINNQCYG